MTANSTAVQVALIAGAVVVGVLLDRLVFATGGHSLGGEGRAANSLRGSGAAAAPGETSGSARQSSPGATEETAAAGAGLSTPSVTASLDAILAERDPRQRLRQLQAFINSLPANGYPDALRRIRKITSSNERALASNLLVAQWGQNDPDGALQFAAGNRGFEYVAEDVFAQLAGGDFDAALERAAGIPGAELRYRALRGVLSAKADIDPMHALQLAAKLGDYRGSEPLTSVVYSQWAATDPQAAAAHAAAQPSEGGWRSPVATVIYTWAQQDPVASANWSLTLSDGQTQARSLADVMRLWTRDDPNAAGNWIHGLDSGAPRDAAVAGLAQSLVSRDPQAAISWIGTITDDAARTRTLQRISSAVLWRDPEKGAELLQAAGLSPEQIRESRRRWER